jgi:hypothetical protein
LKLYLLGLLTFLISLLDVSCVIAQVNKIKATIVDDHSGELLPFANAYFKLQKQGTKTDTNGVFTISPSSIANDTLVLSYVGYKKQYIPLSALTTDSMMHFELTRGSTLKDVVIKTSFNKGVYLWKQLVKRKDAYNRYKYNNFSYEAYNKLEVDIKNFKPTAIQKSNVLKSFNFIFDNVDSTSEKEPFLPVYLIETISELKYQNKPKKYLETIKASNTKGIKNESITKMLGVMEQNVNINNNYIPVMDKDFISPLHDNATAYYNFHVTDTIVIDGKRNFLFTFEPKRPGQYTFTGEAWVEDKSFYLKKITLFIDKEVNINYLSRVTINQEFQMLPDSTCFVKKDKLFADFNFVGKKTLTLIGRKNTSYKDIVVNNNAITELFKTQKQEKVINTDAAKDILSNQVWDSLRYEPLTKNELSIYKSIDKILEMPKFKRLQNTITFLGTGYKSFGKIDIGPWYNWLSNNQWEGTRFRFDINTNTKFNKNIYLHSYLAYGLSDKKVKGQLEAYWLINRKPNRFRLHASFTNDIDNGISNYGEVSQDNFFTFAVRKPNVSRKFLNVRDIRFETFKEWGQGLSTETFVIHRKYNPLLNLPISDNFPIRGSDVLQNFEVAMKIRFAYSEQFLETNYFRYSLGSKYPAVEIVLAQGIADVFRSSYSYTKMSGYIGDYVKVSPFGSFSYRLFGGIINSKQPLPFPYLEIHPGNDIYYYNKHSFNLMTRFEYIGDKYAGLEFEHNIGPGLFRFTPITRKLKWRQFYTFKALTSSLSAKNNALNNPGAIYFNTLNSKLYTEIGTGIDNIFKVFRLDAVWRLSPLPLPIERVKRFGIFGSFQFQF